MVTFIAVIGMSIAPASALGIDTGNERDVLGQIESDEELNSDGESEVNISPGEQLSSTVQTQNNDVQHEIRNRGFVISSERSASPEDKVGEIGAYVESTESEIEELREERERLDEQFESGEIPEGKYYAQVAVIDRQIENTNKSIDSIENQSQDVPVEQLEENGVNTEKLQTLRDNASEMTGDEVSEIAQQIAGNSPSDNNGNGAANQSNGQGQSDIDRNNGENDSEEESDDPEDEEDTNGSQSEENNPSQNNGGVR